MTTEAQAEQINAEIRDEMNRILRAMPSLSTAHVLQLACGNVMHRRNGTGRDPDPTGEIAARDESEYAHSEGAHR